MYLLGVPFRPASHYPSSISYLFDVGLLALVGSGVLDNITYLRHYLCMVDAHCAPFITGARLFDEWDGKSGIAFRGQNKCVPR